MMKMEILANDVLVWRLIGATFWQALIVIATAAVVRIFSTPTFLLQQPLNLLLSPFSFSGWVRATSLCLAFCPAFLAHAAMLTSIEPQNPSVSRAGWQSAAWVAVLLSKLAARLRSLRGAVSTTAYVAVHSASALLCVALGLAGIGQAAGFTSWALWYSGWLAAVYYLHLVYWCGMSILSFFCCYESS
jgi:hypothetical protein